MAGGAEATIAVRHGRCAPECLVDRLIDHVVGPATSFAPASRKHVQDGRRVGWVVEKAQVAGEEAWEHLGQDSLVEGAVQQIRPVVAQLPRGVHDAREGRRGSGRKVGPEGPKAWLWWNGDRPVDLNLCP